ncbi:MAG: hypothetical protein ABIW82_03475 [Dokdonella sp.]
MRAGATRANLILYLLKPFRYGLLCTSVISITVAYAVMIAFAVALTAIGLILLNRGIGLRT